MMDNVIGDDSIMDDLSYLLEDNMRVDSVMDLDLNQEPLDPSSGSGIVFGSLFNELGTTTNQINDRFLHLEGFRARARQRQRWRQARIHLPGNLDVLIGTMGSSEGTEQNGESGEPSTGSRLRLAQGFLLDDQETAHSRIQDRIQHSQIENRIRQLEAVDARARQRQRWRQARNHLPETSDALVESTEGTEQNRETVERVKSCKRDSSHLVAKALELDTEVKKVVSEGGGFFDCNVCLDMARDPILTCCGHLFCWACFYQLPYVYSTAKECPVCKGEVTDSNVTPIFGNGDSNCVSESESGVKVPPRPQAHRIESVRQQRAESVRRIRMQLAARGGDPPQQQDLNPATIDGHIPISELSRNPLLGGGSRRLRSRPFVRVLSEADASLSSTSSELDNPRLFEDYAVMRIQDALMGRTRERILRFDRGNPSTSRAAAEENHHQTLDSAAEINSTATLASSSERADVSSSDGQLENLRTDAPTQMDLTEPSPSTRRRNRLSGVSETDNGASRAPRRRRLNYIL